MPVYALGPDEPQIHADSWIAPDANLIGKVVIEEGASVWFGTTLRADHEEIRVGAGSNVQENCVMHIDPGFELQIGRNCTIGDNSLIGMGATVLNGAKIGRNCLIGAGALITENKVIPDNSLVMGVPGTVVRELDEAADAVAAALVANGFKKGDRAVIYMPTPPIS